MEWPRRRGLAGGALLVALTVAIPSVTFAASGSLDRSFGKGGRVGTAIGLDSAAADVVVQPDGKIVAVGSGGVPDLGDFAVARFKGDGSRDLTFGIGGVVLTDFFLLGDGASSVAMQPDGKIVVAGTVTATLESRDTTPTRVGLVRYNRNGTLDTGFGLAGKVVTDLGGNGAESADGLSIQPDGKIVIAGSMYDNDVPSFAVARYNSDGTLDATFGSSGIAHDSWCGISHATAIALQVDGMIVIAGRDPNCSGFNLARYTSSGVLDVGFGSGGKVMAFQAPIASPEDLAILADGRIVAAGYLGAGGAGGAPSADFAVERYGPAGTLDATFGAGGIASARLDHWSAASAMAVQRDGKIVVAGMTGSDEGTGLRFAVVRYTTDGTLDPAFGNGGKVTTDWGANGGNSGAAGVAIQRDGKIVAVGSSTVTPFELAEFALVRYRAA